MSRCLGQVQVVPAATDLPMRQHVDQQVGLPAVGRPDVNAASRGNARRDLGHDAEVRKLSRAAAVHLLQGYRHRPVRGGKQGEGDVEVAPPLRIVAEGQSLAPGAEGFTVQELGSQRHVHPARAGCPG